MREARYSVLPARAKPHCPHRDNIMWAGKQMVVSSECFVREQSVRLPSVQSKFPYLSLT